jgi:hypothetical protein
MKKAVGLVAALALATLPAAATAKLYFIAGIGHRQVISRVDLNGTHLARSFIGSGLDNPCGLAIAGGHIYWANQGINAVSGDYPGNGMATIGRADLSGHNVQGSFITGASSPCAITSDGIHLYWIDTTATPGPDSLGNGYVSSIARANLDGGSVDLTLVTLPQSCSSCSLVFHGGYLYFGDGPNTIGRVFVNGANLDNSFLRIGGSTEMLELAIGGSDLYWSAGAFSSLGRGPLSGGSAPTSFVPNAAALPKHADGSDQEDVATYGPLIYWSWAYIDAFGRGHGGIAQMNQNGSHRRQNFLIDPDIANGGIGMVAGPG